MREIISKINQEIKDFNVNPQTITDLIDKIRELQEQDSTITRIICEDDFQVLRLARLFIIKLLDTNGQRNHVQITRDEWREENINFSLIKFWIDDFELNRLISHKFYALGGHAGFDVVRQRDLLSYIYDEIKNVIDNLRLDSESPEIISTDVTEQVQERRETQIKNTLDQFKQFVERDGWRAFWTNGTVRANNLKNHPEEIGKSQIMAFLKGFGITFEIHHNTFQEVQEGAGFCDVIHIDHLGKKFVFELKIWRGDSYYQTGITELGNYLSHEHLDEGFYIIFDPRVRDKTSLDSSIQTENNKRIHIIQIDIAQIAPTRQSNP